jgi:hypothetical protein
MLKTKFMKVSDRLSLIKIWKNLPAYYKLCAKHMITIIAEIAIL